MKNDLSKVVRLDLVIAVCALLISSLATAASWWQTRASWQQTKIIEQQLSAQVWPYLSVSETLDGDTTRVTLVNDGLGPAVLRSASAYVDGKPQANFVDVMHAILGPNLIARKPRGEKMSLGLSGEGVGSVIRAGETTTVLALTSKHFAPLFIRDYRRMTVTTCYCAIVPGTCWRSDSGSSGDPVPLAMCPDVPRDLLHDSSIGVLLYPKF